MMPSVPGASGRRVAPRRARMPAPISAIGMLVACAALALSCVSGFQRDYPERVRYVLDLHRGGAPRDRGGDAGVSGDRDRGALVVRPLASSPGYERRGLVYALPGGRLESDFYHEFFVPAPTMISTITRTWLRDAGLFDSVVGTGSLVDARYVLEGSVRRLVGDFRDSSDPAAHAILQYLLLENTPAGPVVRHQADYDRRVPIDGTDPGDVVGGLSLAVSEALAALERDLAEALAARP